MKDHSKRNLNMSCLSHVIKAVNLLSVCGLAVMTGLRIKLALSRADNFLEPFFYLLTLYLIPFTFLLLCAEMKWHSFLKSVQFLNHIIGKGLFLMFLGLLLFSTDSEQELVGSVAVTLVGVLNLIAACFFPAQESSSLFGGV